MSRIALKSRASWPRHTWSWDTKSARTRPGWRKHRLTFPPRAPTMRQPSKSSRRRPAGGIEIGRQHVTNSRTSKKSALTIPRAAFGTLPTSPQQYASATMPHARRFDCPSRTATSKRTLPTSSLTLAPARRSLMLPNSSTSVEGTPRRRRRPLKMRTTRSHSLPGL